MKIANKMTYYTNREKPEKLVKYKKEDETAAHLTNTVKTKEYEYYVCDYCGKEIKIENNWEKSTGGICDIPVTVTNNKKITLALHNNCINNVIHEFKKK